MLNFAGSWNTTISNVTIETFVTLTASTTVIGHRNNPAWIPQDEVLQIFSVDKIYLTMPENPTGERTGLIGWLTPLGSTREYHYIFSDSKFDKRMNDAKVYLVVLGQFIEEVKLTNLTYSNSQIAERGISILTSRSISVNGINFQSNVINGITIFHFTLWISVTIQNMVLDNNTLITSNTELVRITGMGAPVTLLNTSISNSNFFKSSAIHLRNNFGQITITKLLWENVTTHVDSSIIDIDLATILQASNLSFTNISSYDFDSSNNYMISIVSIDLAASYPSLLQNITVQNSSIGVLKIQNFRGSFSGNNMFVIQDVHILECQVPNNIDLIILNSLSTDDPYAMIFQNLIFYNIEFLKGAHLFNFRHLLSVPVQIINSTLRSISGAKIRVGSFTTKIGNLSTAIQLINITGDNINPKFNSFIELYTGAELCISDSSFTNINSYEEGSVLFAGTRLTQTKIVNTVFENNTALLGGVMFIEQQSIVNCMNCTFNNNFAVEGGVVAIFDNGVFVFNESVFTNNIAISGLVANIFSSVSESSILASTITNNVFIDSSSIINEITKAWSVLWFLQNDFKMFIKNDTKVLNVVESQYAIKSVIGNVNISEVDIFEQDQFIDAYSSTFVMNHINIKNITFTVPVIKTSVSIFNGSNIDIVNIRNPSNSTSFFISCSIDSVIHISGLNYTSSQASLILLNNVMGTIDALDITNVSSTRPMIQIYSSFDIRLSWITINQIETKSSSIVSVTDSFRSELNNIAVSNISQLAIQIHNSVIDKAVLLDFRNCHQGLKLLEHSTIKVNSSMFDNVGDSNVISGGAIHSSDSNMTISNSRFINCEAKRGGWMALLCNKDTICSYNINMSQFDNSVAHVKGGAIYYDLYRPKMDDVTFKNNSAIYGNDIASYPIKIALINTSSDNIILNNVVSGQIYSPALEFRLVDHDGQTISTDNSSTIKVSSVQNDTSVDGTLRAVTNQGIVRFDELIFNVKPGSNNINFNIDSAAIEKDKVDLRYNGTVHQQMIDASFRFWVSGEIEVNDQWQVWSPGTYSLGTNKTQCLSWVDNAVCLGGNQINVENGYFRNSYESDSIIECIRKESCKGGYIVNSSYPVRWQDGYEGLLCSECTVNVDAKYERDSSFVCSKWPDLTLNLIRILGIMLAILTYLTYLIAINLKKTTESKSTTLMRILTNYLQVISTFLAFDASYPDSISNLFAPANIIGSSSEAFVSVDCFIEGSKMNGFAPNATIFKIFLMSILPFMLIIFYSLMWTIMYLLLNKYFNDIKRSIIVSIIVILFLLHPALTRAGLSIFQWVLVDKNNFRARLEINMKWYSSEHLIWWWLLGIPIILVWGIGMPVWALVILIKWRQSLDQWNVQKYMLVLYQGLKLDRFYWELINTARKTVLLSVPAFLSTESLNYKVLSATVIMVVMLRIQQRLEPYKADENNYLEYNEILTGTLTVFWAMIFQDRDNNQASINLVVFLICKHQKFFNLNYSNHDKYKICVALDTLYIGDAKVFSLQKGFTNNWLLIIDQAAQKWHWCQ